MYNQFQVVRTFIGGDGVCASPGDIYELESIIQTREGISQARMVLTRTEFELSSEILFVNLDAFDFIFAGVGGCWSNE